MGLLARGIVTESESSTGAPEAERMQVMKLRNIVMKKITIWKLEKEERSKIPPPPLEIRLRVFEIPLQDDIDIRERSVTVKAPSLFGWYHILKARHHWRVFQAIRDAIWLAR
jgi:hypothetical protein